MYEIFDKFLAVPTWHTNHDTDVARFYRALDQVVKVDAFNPDEMADYMREKVGVSPDDESDLADAIWRFNTAAWAVRDYLRAIGTI